jgi:ATP-dependent Lhr-like helicase
VVDAASRGRWWTFAGWKANLALAEATAHLRREVSAIDDLSIAVDGHVGLADIGAALQGIETATASVSDKAVSGLKFSDCLPRHLAIKVLAERLRDTDSTNRAVGERLTAWRT